MSTVYRLTLMSSDITGEPVVIDVTDVVMPKGSESCFPPEMTPLEFIERMLSWVSFTGRRVAANGDLGPRMVIRCGLIATAHVVEKAGYTSADGESEVAA